MHKYTNTQTHRHTDTQTHAHTHAHTHTRHRHMHAHTVLCQLLAASSGQRALIGKVNMDINCPDSYREATSSSISDTVE